MIDEKKILKKIDERIIQESNNQAALALLERGRFK